MYEKYLALLSKTNETSYQVSKMTGIPQARFSEWKRGKWTPSVAAIVKIARHFEVPVDYFTSCIE